MRPCRMCCPVVVMVVEMVSCAGGFCRWHALISVLLLLLFMAPLIRQEAFDAQSFVSRLLGFGDMKGLMQQIQESQEGSGDPKEMMCVA